jgi:hypothetical protein
MLAVRVLRDQNVDILAVAFVTPFFGSARAEKAAKLLGVPIRPIDITGVHFEVVKRPLHGWGRNMNPCIDCHALMLKTAGKIMEAEGYDFLFTGEVLNERPMSQNRGALAVVAKESGYPDLILRPLSAKLLPLTKPERDGLIDRERLLAFSGRTRKPQMELAKRYGIADYPSPAGGCLLTDPAYSKRLRDLLDHEADPSIDDVRLLSLGRHFRLGEKTKLILGRNKAENDTLESSFRPGDVKLFVVDVMGPTGLLRGPADTAVRRLAASLCARYSDAPRDREARVRFTLGDAPEDLSVLPATQETIDPLLV